tara:strand:- start:193 stop:294 length:102 start_codon:yes stop_codon:yes gene_type:complete
MLEEDHFVTDSGTPIREPWLPLLEEDNWRRITL